MVASHLKKPGSGPYPYKAMETPPSVLRSIVFDCDGVLMDSEPLHYAAFKSALAADGEPLTEEIYRERYLPFDDRGAFTHFFQDAKKPLSHDDLGKLIEAKGVAFRQRVESDGVLAFPAVPEFVMAVSQRYPLAVASGSRRDELELMLEAAGIRAYFEVIVSADEVSQGKPHPESFLKAVEALNGTGKRPTAIQPSECVVIEDAREGIVAAHAAGMKCVAVATSYPSYELSKADLVVPSLAALRVSQLEDLFHPPTPMPVAAPQSN